MIRWSDGRERTQDEVQAARLFAADVERRCISAARAGDFRVNDLEGYVAWLEESIAKTLAGDNDGNFTIWQRMNTFLTGACVPLLAPIKGASA